MRNAEKKKVLGSGKGERYDLTGLETNDRKSVGRTKFRVFGRRQIKAALALRVAEINKYTRIAPDFGSSSRRANGSILFICDFWCNAEGGPKDKQDCGFICFRDPKVKGYFYLPFTFCLKPYTL
jgi:hypothetical protein